MKTKSGEKTLIHHFVDLLFPRSCSGCENILLHNENLICTHCTVDLPKTNWHQYPENPVRKIFYGRCKTGQVTSFLHFRKGSLVQNILHCIKYKGQQELGEHIGHLFGQDIRNEDWVKSVDAIIPIPLHRKKEKLRGYNQSELLGKGLARAMQVPIDTTSFTRYKFTESQTMKDRLERQLNLDRAFFCEKFSFKSILVVDDVITTGATIESAVNCIQEANPDCQINIASLAIAE